ncbi:Cytochrome P450 [Corchorus olitorius]|uniref:Cytochrome P450 n=1 Tax=Corchorus olitorius TaxID=93759 RepID=A0A1R3IEC3_9ROSI|nr:Cytochrome P450 [Corchorus olitorius]
MERLMQMELLSWLLCLVLFLVLVQALYSITRRSKKLPPGPPTIPIFGNLFQLGDRPHKSLAKLSKTHGDIMTLKLGQKTTIVVSSAAMAKEILQKHDASFSNRTIPDAIRALQHHQAGMPWMPVSTTWRHLRKICNLQIFTSQKLDANQSLRRTKVEQLVADVQRSCRVGEAVNIGQAAFKTTLSLISNTIFSFDLADSSDTAQEFREIIRATMEDLGKPNFGDYFPIIQSLDLQGIRRRMTIHFGKLMNLFDRVIDERLELRKMKDYDLFAGATETATSTFEWAMTELLRNPKALQEARKELNEGKLMEESDVARLPYLQAIVKETLRMHPPVPLLVPRKAGADIEIENFIVPKGAQVFVNAWAISRDPNFWEEPEEFLPERFMKSEMDVKGRDFGLIPFGGGRRICPGLPFAMRMLHLMLGRLIQTFDWKLEDGVTPETLDMDDSFGLVIQKAKPLRAIPIPI